MPDAPDSPQDDLDAFFAAADSGQPVALRRAAHNIGDRPSDTQEALRVIDELAQLAAGDDARQSEARDGWQYDFSRDSGDSAAARSAAAAFKKGKNAGGKFIAIEPGDFAGGPVDADKPFVLIPANIHRYFPWWAWASIVLALMMLVAGVVLMPVLGLDRLVSHLGDANETTARNAMRRLVIEGNERTVKKLYGMAMSDREELGARLRAVDTMSLIERVPEVDRALLRLELSAGTDDKVREAAIAARKQREAYKTRAGRP